MSLLILLAGAGAAANLALTGLPSAEAFGSLTTSAQTALTLSGLAGAEAFGSFSLASPATLALTGVTTSEAFGAPALTTQAALLSLGLPSAESFGTATLQAAALLAPNGLMSAESFGALSLARGALPFTLTPAGIPSAEQGGVSRLKLTLCRRVTYYPNGQILTFMALTPAAINAVLQTLTCQMLGLDPTLDPLAYAKVRLDWPTGGQPAWAITDDVCFLKATEEDDAYNRVRDRVWTPQDSASVLAQDTYTRVWRVSWSFYGPTAFDNARLLKSTLLTVDFPSDTLQMSKLYLITDTQATTRSPELFQGQWWERTDFSIKLNELVEETLSVPTIASAEILLETERGVQADLTVA